MTGKLVTGIGNRVERLVGRVLSIGPVKRLLEVMDSYDRAGGGLLASGLAFSSLFALLPAILLIIGLAGIVLSDPARLATLSADLSARFPPLAIFFQEALGAMAAGALANSIIGLIGLVWGASRFYDSLDNAIGRIFEGNVRRNPIERGIRGVLVILIAIGVGVGGFVVVNIIAAFAATGPAESGLIGRFLNLLSESIVVNLAFFCVILGMVYRFVPTVHPSWRAVSGPALVLGLLAALLTQLFALLGPLLVGGLKVYGAFVAVFAAMIWLSFIAQGLLIGAAWVRARTLAPLDVSAPGPSDGGPSEAIPEPTADPR